MLDNVFSDSNLNKIKQNISKLALPMYQDSLLDPPRSGHMTEEFVKCGGFDALEQLQYCPNQLIYKRVQEIITRHFPSKGSEAAQMTYMI